jgi:hypothetical protein
MKADIKETYRLPADDEPDLFIGFADEAALRGPYNGQLVMSRSTVRVPVSVLLLGVGKPNMRNVRSHITIDGGFVTPLRKTITSLCLSSSLGWRTVTSLAVSETLCTYGLFVTVRTRGALITLNTKIRSLGDTVGGSRARSFPRIRSTVEKVAQ